MTNLPKEWENATLADVTAPFASVDPRKSPNNKFRYIDIGCIDNKTHTVQHSKEFLGRDAPSRARRIVKAGDVLFSTVRTYLKNIARVPIALDGALTSTGISVLRPRNGVDGQFLFHWVRSDAFVDEISKAQDGTMYPAVTDRDVSAGLFPLPPTAEQQRIAAKCDALLATTRRSREELDRVPMLVEKYRRSILAAAFSGELTQDWRETRKIAKSRDAKLGDVVAELRYGTSKKCIAKSDGIAVLRIPNVSSGRIDLSDLKYARLDDRELSKLRLQTGDILVVRSNGSVDLVGRPALVSDAEAGLAYAGYLIRLRPILSKLVPQFLAYMLDAPQVRAVIETGARSTSGVHNVNATELAAISIPHPEYSEQEEIVGRIRQAFVRIDEMVKQHALAADLLTKLDREILAKAFRGELVPQDPHDEPASVLLERMRNERDQMTPERIQRPRLSRSAPASEPKQRAAKTMRKGRKSMGKKRSEVERDHLRKALRSLGGSAPARELWQQSDMDIDEFYKQLRQEMKSGRITEGASKDQLVLVDAA